MRWSVWAIAFILVACSSIERSQNEKIKQSNESKEPVYRNSKERLYPVAELKIQVRDLYPWESGYEGRHPKVIKEDFRCKGGSKHSLPVSGGKEFIYPILIDLLNYIQIKTSCPVVITCGHRCPAHNSYADASIYNLSSKHTIGAEVDFYVVGMENKSQVVIDLIMRYYTEKECYQGCCEYSKFQRLDSKKVNISTDPWYNKEILIKLYQEGEGRDFDNQHSNPYLSIQVRFDREKEEKVLYSWEKAFNGYMRY